MSMATTSSMFGSFSFGMGFLPTGCRIDYMIYRTWQDIVGQGIVGQGVVGQASSAPDWADPAASTLHGVVFQNLVGGIGAVNIDIRSSHALRTAPSRAVGPPAGKSHFASFARAETVVPNTAFRTFRILP